MLLELKLAEFQFLIGRLDTETESNEGCKRQAFQFLIGRLDTN